jgi:uncharacterized protein (TIGR03437 family)
MLECLMRGPILAAMLVLPLSATAQIPVVFPGGVLNGASFARAGESGHAISPGSLVSIFGQFFVPAPEVASGIPLPVELAGIGVTFNGKRAPLTFVSNGQINAQLPWDAASETPPGSTGQVSVVVIRNALPSAPVVVQVARLSPGIYTFNGRLAVAVNAADGTIAQANGSLAGLGTHAAEVGSVVILYANGLGPVDRPVFDGNLSSDPITRTLSEPTVRLGGVEASVLYSGLAPQFVGVNQLNVLLPANVPTGDAVPIQIQLGGITTSEAISIAVR